MRSICSSPLILLDLIALTIFVEAYKLRNSPLCSFLYPPDIFSLLEPNFLLSKLSSDTFKI
jgi:hypothetical protein